MAKSDLLGSFVGTLFVKYIDGNSWEVDQDPTQPFGIYIEGHGAIYPKHGFRFDFASIPPVVRAIYKKAGTGKSNGKYGRAATIHDWLYSHPPKWCDRKLADRIFLLGMEIDGVRYTMRSLFYRMVRLFGGRYYNRPEKLKELRSQ